MADQVVVTTIKIISFIIQWKRDFDDSQDALTTIVTTVELVKNSLIGLDTKSYHNMETPLRALMDCLSETKDILVAYSKKKGLLSQIFFPRSVSAQIEIVENRIIKLVSIMNLTVSTTHLANSNGIPRKPNALDFIVSEETKKFWKSSFGETVYAVKCEDLEKALMSRYTDFLDSEALCDLRLRLDNLKTGYISCHRLSDFCGNDSLSKRLGDYTKKTKSAHAPPPSPQQGDFITFPLLLWVDDKPENNETEIAFSRTKGVCTVVLHSTSEAKQWIIRHPDLLDEPNPHRFRIITDNAREGADTALDINAGEDMIRFVRGRRSTVPILVYCGNLEYTKYTHSYKECSATNKRPDCFRFIDELRK